MNPYPSKDNYVAKGARNQATNSQQNQNMSENIFLLIEPELVVCNGSSRNGVQYVAVSLEIKVL